MKYRPRRAGKRWQEGAPEYVLDVFDHPKFADRYTVLFGGSMLDPQLTKDRKVYCLGLSDDPTSPNGFSMWGECPASWRPSHRRIRWLDLPQHIRDHVVARATRED
ncbi:MAG: hypothetical protein WA045_11800 [Nitrospira sp.]